MSELNFACVFPGQGSQSVGMLADLFDHPAVSATLDEASSILAIDVKKLMLEGPKASLDLTENTQPLMLAAGVAMYRFWLAEQGPEPTVLAGHSLGEYSALVAAQSLTLAQALPLVRYRAQVMQAAVPAGTGAMAAVLGLDADVVRAECARIGAGGNLVEAVNFNSPEQTVIAGTKSGIELAMVALKERGAKRVLPLPVSAPFHSSLLSTAAEQLREYLAGVVFAKPRIAVINNVDVAVADEPEAIRDALFRQANHPVRWVETVQKMAADGVRTIVECGPGKVLAGLSKRIDADLRGLALYDRASLSEVKANLSHD